MEPWGSFGGGGTHFQIPLVLDRRLLSIAIVVREFDDGNLKDRMASRVVIPTKD